MTNAEFNVKLSEMYAKHPLLARHEVHTLNELVYVLRLHGEQDYSISTNNGKCIPSIRETFIPVEWLAKKVSNLEYQEIKDEIDGTMYEYSILVMDLQ